MPRKKKDDDAPITRPKRAPRKRPTDDDTFDSWVRSAMIPRFTVNFDSEPTAPPLDFAKLAQLKDAEPYRVTERMPDMVECITAWRAWRVVHANEGLRLQALGVSHVWEPRKAVEARCKTDASPGRLVGVFGGLSSRNPAPKHRAPAWNCECGIWAFKELDGLVSALGKYSDVYVLGNVQLWGRVIETENGYRAQYAYPSELWLLDESLEELGLVYDVPVRMIRA